MATTSHRTHSAVLYALELACYREVLLFLSGGHSWASSLQSWPTLWLAWAAYACMRVSQLFARAIHTETTGEKQGKEGSTAPLPKHAALPPPPSQQPAASAHMALPASAGTPRQPTSALSPAPSTPPRQVHSSDAAAAASAEPLPPRTPSHDADALSTALGSPKSPVFIPYSRLPPDGSRQYERVVLTLGYRLEQVMDALDKKFSLRPTGSPADKLQPSSVLSINYEVQRSISMEGGSSVLLRRQRIVVGLDDVPWMLRRMVGASDLQYIVDTEYHSEDRLLLSVARNVGMESLGTFQEAACYRVHPDDDRCTLYTSRVEVRATNWVGEKLLATAGGDGLALIQAHLLLLRARLRELHGEEVVATGP